MNINQYHRIIDKYDRYLVDRFDVHVDFYYTMCFNDMFLVDTLVYDLLLENYNTLLGRSKKTKESKILQQIDFYIINKLV